MKLVNGVLALFISFTANLHGAVRATYYGERFEGRPMANGSIYHVNAVTAASNDYPLGTILKVMNLLTHKGIYVAVTDRSAETKKPHIDLSKAAFELLGLSYKKGWGWVTVTPIKGEQ